MSHSKLPASRLLTLAVALCLVTLGTGCASAVYQPSNVAGFELEPQQEIDDDDIRKAFEARPQVPSKPSVSYYVFDDDYAEGVEEMLGGVSRVQSTYRIPALMVSGKRRFDQAPSHRYGYQEQAKPLSMKKLRLLAARAHTDLLVVVDYGYRVSDAPNELAALGVLLIPIFFAPMRDIEVESYVDSYVIDTRNGYLYGHVQTSKLSEEDYVNVWESPTDKMVEGQFAELMTKTSKLMAKLLDDERVPSKLPLEKAPKPATEPSTEPDGGEPSGDEDGKAGAPDAISARQVSEDGQSR